MDCLKGGMGVGGEREIWLICDLGPFFSLFSFVQYTLPFFCLALCCSYV